MTSSDVFVLSDIKSKSQTYYIYNHIKRKRKVTNPVIKATVTIECLVLGGKTWIR